MKWMCTGDLKFKKVVSKSDVGSVDDFFGFGCSMSVTDCKKKYNGDSIVWCLNMRMLKTMAAYLLMK
jgi:hypothetical protein